MSGNEEEPVMTPIVSGVLCFMSTARHSMRADDMVRVCHSFYKEDDINKAKDILLDMITDPAKSIPKRRRGKDKLIHELEDINELLKVCDDGSIKLPKFVVDSYNGLPPTSGFEFIGDYLAKLNDELATLRREVETLKDIRVEHSVTTHDTVVMKEDLLHIKAEVRKLNHRLMASDMQRDSLLLESLRKATNNDNDEDGEINLFQDIDDALPSAPAFESSQGLLDVVNRTLQDIGGTPSAPSYAESARSKSPLICSGGIVKAHKSKERHSLTRLISKNPIHKEPVIQEHGDTDARNEVDEDGYQTVQKKKRRHSNRIVGSKKSSESVIMKCAPKCVDIYIGNVNLGIDTEIVTQYIKGETGIDIKNCIALNTRNPNHTSFKISVALADRETLLSADVWPEGVICRKFHSPRSFNSR